MAKKTKISAQVIFRPASGKKLDPKTPITAENIAQFVPRPESVETATRLFAKFGFEVTPLVGNSFSITAPEAVFEKAFRIQLQTSAEKGAMFVDDEGDARRRLPRKLLPKEIRDTVEVISFTEPPDFGPTQFSF